jgi:hypothetical protein
LRPFTRTDPGEIDPVGIQAEDIQDRLDDPHTPPRLIVATNIVAFTEVSPAYPYRIRTFYQCVQNIDWIHRA